MGPEGRGAATPPGAVPPDDPYRRAQERRRRVRLLQNVGLALLAVGVLILVYAALGVATR